MIKTEPSWAKPYCCCLCLTPILGGGFQAHGDSEYPCRLGSNSHSAQGFRLISLLYYSRRSPQWQCPSFPPHPFISPSFPGFTNRFAGLQSDPTASRHQRNMTDLLQFLSTWGKLHLNQPLFPQTSTLCKWHPPENMAHLKLQGFDTTNGKPMQNKEKLHPVFAISLGGQVKLQSHSSALLSSLAEHCLLTRAQIFTPAQPATFLWAVSEEQKTFHWEEQTQISLIANPPLTPVIFSKVLKSKKTP